MTGARAAIVVLAIAAACELRPQPKPAPQIALPPPEPPDAAVPPAPIAIDAAPALDAPLADAGVTPSADCVTTAERIASVVIESSDPGVRGNFEQSRARMVQMMAEACTAQGWNADKQRCFQLAKLEADIRACEAKYPRPDAGRGSAMLDAGG